MAVRHSTPTPRRCATCSVACKKVRPAWSSSYRPLAGLSGVSRERSWEPEPRQNTLLEARQRADPVATEGKHEQAGPMPDPVRGTQVGTKRRLAVGSRWDQLEPAARVEQAGEEVAGDFSALILERHWWHRNEDVIGQQSHQCVDVRGLIRADELGHNRMLAGRFSGRRHGLTAGYPLLALHASARSFQGAIDRLNCGVEHVGHFTGVESEDVAQDEDG